MKIRVHRFEYGANYTVSRLYVDESYECFVLEDVVRAPEVKVQDATAIPAGTYELVIDYSPHFGKSLPHILNVPGFTGIRIHWGNTDLNTDGCLLVGKTWPGADFIGNSVLAYNALMDKIQAALDKSETLSITIENS